MGAACGSNKEISIPIRINEVEHGKKPRQRKLTSLDDVIKTKQRKSADIRLTDN